MAILTTLIRHLSARFSSPVDILASGAWTRPLLEGQPGVGDLYVVSSRKRPYWFSLEQQQLARRLRARGSSATWLCDEGERNLKTRWLLRRAGWSPQQICEYNFAPGPHMCELFLRFAYCSPAVVAAERETLRQTGAYSQLVVNDRQRSELDQWLASHGWSQRPIVLLQFGNKRTMRPGLRQRSSNTKYWPEQNWAAVLQGLRARRADHLLLLLGVPQEAALNDDILRLARIEGAFNIANDASLPRLMALAERAQGMISVDTGPAHVAAAVGCSIVTLFGKVDPGLYAPRGPKGHVTCLTGQVNGEPSMLGITPEQVLAAWDALMEKMAAAAMR